MEILLLVAVIVVGVSALYVAATFNKRTRLNAAPLVNSVAKRFEESGNDLRQQLNAIAIELQEERASIDLDRGRTQERLDHADRQISSISDKLSTGLDTIKRHGTRQDQFSNSVQQQLDGQAAQLSDSLSRLSAQVARIEAHLRSQETQNATNPERLNGNESTEGP
jgi:hypothetical protein